jgi:hypothetical protein
MDYPIRGNEVTTVWFLTVSGDHPWVARNNARFIGLSSMYPNVVVGYWGDIAATISGMSSDGFHLGTDASKQAYADYIAVWTGIQPLG